MATEGRHQTWAPTEGHHRHCAPYCNIPIATHVLLAVVANVLWSMQVDIMKNSSVCVRRSALGCLLQKQEGSRQYILCVLRPSA